MKKHQRKARAYEMSKSRKKLSAAEKRIKRAENLKLIHQEYIDKKLKERKEPPPKTKKSKLVSVHRDIDDHNSMVYVNKLKQKPTESEVIVENFLKKSKKSYIFQMPIKNDYSFYIIDFYLPKQLLCIEIDGEYHNDPIQIWRDKQRDKFLVENGYKVIRLSNLEVSKMTYLDFIYKIKK